MAAAAGITVAVARETTLDSLEEIMLSDSFTTSLVMILSNIWLEVSETYIRLSNLADRVANIVTTCWECIGLMEIYWTLLKVREDATLN